MKTQLYSFDAKAVIYTGSLLDVYNYVDDMIKRNGYTVLEQTPTHVVVASKYGSVKRYNIEQ